jgi:hypothetical protein
MWVVYFYMSREPRPLCRPFPVQVRTEQTWELALAQRQKTFEHACPPDSLSLVVTCAV